MATPISDNPDSRSSHLVHDEAHEHQNHRSCVALAMPMANIQSTDVEFAGVCARVCVPPFPTESMSAISFLAIRSDLVSISATQPSSVRPPISCSTALSTLPVFAFAWSTAYARRHTTGWNAFDMIRASIGRRTAQTPKASDIGIRLPDS